MDNRNQKTSIISWIYMRGLNRTNWFNATNQSGIALYQFDKTKLIDINKFKKTTHYSEFNRKKVAET